MDTLSLAFFLSSVCSSNTTAQAVGRVESTSYADVAADLRAVKHEGLWHLYQLIHRLKLLRTLKWGLQATG